MNAEVSGNVLIVDDEINIRKGLQAMLRKDGHTIRDAGSGTEALNIVQTFACEAAIIDIRMPGMQGTELLREMKVRRPFLAVILLTGHGTLQTAMTAIQEGAHNYLLKPAKPEKLRESVREAIIAARRQVQEANLLNTLRTGLQQLETLPTAPPPPLAGLPSVQNIGDLRIDRQAHTVHYAGEPISLTPSEYNVLLILAEKPGQAIDYITLVKLGLDYEAEPWEAKELIKRHIYTLRQKLEPDPTSPRSIINVRAVGYRLASRNH
jgi:DNA-binding response OmpR family regulator